jgi:ribosomal protein S18 acetylase RimI-like enzyme
MAGGPASERAIRFVDASADDLDALVALRIAAMRESLERIGRFDPQRARERFAAGFAPECTRHIVVDDERVGFVVVKPLLDALLLDHLYLAPGVQRRGIGAAVLADVFARADEQRLPLRVGALRESDANRFYERHGFVLVERTEFDNHYLRAPMELRPYQPDDEAAVIALWHACGLTRPWNNPKLDIERKLTVQPEMFLVIVEAGVLAATAMIGYDGHRGWVNYLAVAESHRRRGLARRLMDEAERALIARGCPKINLQVRSTNVEVLAFYARLGYGQDDVVSFGRRLIPD